MYRVFISGFIIFFFAFLISGEANIPDGDDEEIEKLLEMSLEELMEVPVYVASRKETTVRTSPGIVSVITAEEIEYSGARDLIDLLRMVPGLDFGVQNENEIGIGVRGGWAYEGKLLLLVDGMEMNEPLNGSVTFGLHYPIEFIKKIEIIRGPGSVIHGGFGEYGVINIITKHGDDVGGLYLSSGASWMSEEGVVNIPASLTDSSLSGTYGHRTFNMMFGKRSGDFSVSALLFKGDGHRSDREYTDILDTSFDMEDSNEVDTIFLNLGLNYKNVYSKIIIDRHNLNTEDLRTRVFKDTVFENNYSTNIFQLGFKSKLTDKIEMKTEFNYFKYTPSESIRNGTIYSSVSSERYKAILSVDSEIYENLYFVNGGEFQYELFESKLESVKKEQDPDYVDYPKYSNLTLFSEAVYLSEKLGNVTAGVRFDRHNAYGMNLAPRLAYTKAWKKFHFKLLYSNAFRSPTVVNYRSNSDIKPEITNVLEAETGFQINSSMAFTLNLFEIWSDDIIVYGLSEDNQPAYRNSDKKTESRGFEAEFRFINKQLSLTANYSYYHVISTMDDYKVIDFHKDEVVDETMHLAFPAHKATVKTIVKPFKDFSIAADLIFYSHRYSYEDTKPQAGLNKQWELKKYQPTTLVNLFIRYDNIFLKNLDAGVGIYDIAGANYEYLQPFSSGHAPFPAQSREVSFKLIYSY